MTDTHSFKRKILTPIRISVIIPLLLILFCVIPVSAETTIILQTANVDNLGDSFVASTYPNTNFGTQDFVLTNNNVTVSFIYIKFNLSRIPEGATIIESHLGLYEYITANSTFNVYHQFTDLWNENTITWNNQPCPDGCNETFESSNSDLKTTGWKYWTVTNMVINATVNDKSNISMFIGNNTSGNPVVWFKSKEHTDISHRPFLSITYNTELQTDFDNFTTMQLSIFNIVLTAFMQPPLLFISYFIIFVSMIMLVAKLMRGNKI